MAVRTLTMRQTYSRQSPLRRPSTSPTVLPPGAADRGPCVGSRSCRSCPAFMMSVADRGTADRSAAVPRSPTALRPVGRHSAGAGGGSCGGAREAECREHHRRAAGSLISRCG